jgi:hypothetical protein
LLPAPRLGPEEEDEFLEAGLRRTKKLWRNHNQRIDVCLFQFCHKSCRLYRCGFNIYLLFLLLLGHAEEDARQKF